MSKATNVLGAAGTGAAVGGVIGPWGAVAGGVIGGLGALLGGGGDAPPAPPPVTPYNPNPGAFGPTPVDFGQGPSAPTQSAQDQLAALQQQQQQELAANQPSEQETQLKTQIDQLQQQYDSLPSFGPGMQQRFELGHQLQELHAQYDPMTQQRQKAVADINTKYGPQISQLSTQVQSSAHNDQLGYLSQMAVGANHRGPPQVNQGPAQIDWSQSPLDVQMSREALASGRSLLGGPLTAEARAAAQAKVDAYQQQENLKNPLYVAAQQQQADRAQQGQLIGTLQNAAAGNGPSAALSTLYAGRDANINQAQSMANSARGSTGAQALAERAAMQQGAMATQQTAQQAAIMRANEMNQAYTQLGTALQSQRGGDQAYNAQNIDVAKTNAGLQQGTTGQNDTTGLNYSDLYFKALNGDRDAQMQLEALRSSNQNAANSINSGQGIANQQVQYNQGVQDDKKAAAAVGAIGTLGAGISSGSGNSGGSTKDNSPSSWGY